ncbi:MAG: hypothetical protein WAN10_18990 [Candidatus Acidiferrales bacterium]
MDNSSNRVDVVQCENVERRPTPDTVHGYDIVRSRWHSNNVKHIAIV